MNKRTGLVTSSLLAGLTIALGLVWPSASQAQDRVWVRTGNGQGRWVDVHRPAPRQPRKYYLLRKPSRSPRVKVKVKQRPVNDSPSPSGYQGPFDRNPYDNEGFVVAGVGGGGLIHFGQGTQVAPAWRLHLGLALDQAEFALGFDLGPGALDVPAESGDGKTEASLYTAGASFNYRFLRDAIVHPVVGAGLETIVLSPEQGTRGSAFAATGRVGLELAYPLDHGSLAVGIDARGHMPFIQTEDYATDAAPMLGFGAYGHYRF